MTLHVRMVSPPDLTELLTDALIADSGVTNLVVLTGSARRPDGDAVQFDVLARSANSVLGQVRALQGDRPSSIVIENVDAARPRSTTWSKGTSLRYGIWSKPRSAQMPSTRPASISCSLSPG
jgi:hypothetical protein